MAFEPASDTADKLCAAARRNGLLMEVVRTALGEHRGQCESTPTRNTARQMPACACSTATVCSWRPCRRGQNL